MKNIISIHKWVGIKNDTTKQTEGGYLYIHFNSDTKLLPRFEETLISQDREYKAGQTIGFSLKAQSRKEAIQMFQNKYKIVPESTIRYYKAPMPNTIAEQQELIE
ncbi:MAG: hypothetical protein Q8941_20470, partial [Bacteroidota bacterium]|nr:hypothetical protein [Bacteroidota bacterium]